MRSQVILTVLTFVVLAGCSDNRNSSLSQEKQQQIDRGEALFMDHCDRCHPRGGRGDYLKRIPVTLLTRRSETELVNWIEGSEKHREMPNFSSLSDRERHDLATYLMSEVPPR